MVRKYKSIFIVIGISLFYFGAALLSLNLAFEKTNASPIWPPSGIAFAAILIFGRKALWGIFAGAVAANFFTFQGNHQFSAEILLCSLLIGIGNTLEAYLGEKFYRSFNQGSSPLDNYSHFFKMLMVTFAACLAGALIGTLSLLITNIINFDLFRTVLVTWWMGDYVGILIVTPLILSVALLKRYRMEKENQLEYLIHLVILIATCTVIFSNIGSESILSQMSFVILPFLLWMVYRFSVPFISVAVAVVSLISVLGTVNGYGPFIRPELNESLLLLQAFMGISSVTFVALAITLDERKAVKQLPLTESSLKYSVWFSAIGFIVCLSVSLFVIYSIEQKKDRKVLSRIQEEISQVNNTISRQLEYITEGLSRMGKRRGTNINMLPEEWQDDAGEYFTDFSIFSALESVDSNYRVQWVYPLEAPGHSIGLNLNFESKRKLTLDAARAHREVTISDPLDLIKGGRGVIIAAPVYNKEEFKGFILGICDIEKLFKSFIAKSEENYFVQVNIQEMPEYSSENLRDNFYRFSGAGSYAGLEWSLKFVPRPGFLKFLGKEPNIFSVVIAFLISVLFSLTVYLIFNARFKARSLYELNENLQRKNVELNKEKEISQQAALAKSQFLANMSHEIRTPMNGVLGALQLAMDSRDDEIRNYLKVIDISAQNLMDIINDILDYSKIEAGKLTLEVIPFDMKKLVQESLIILEGKARSQKVELSAEFKLDSANHFKSDPTRIRQILLNLLSNAVKFTTGGSVHVDIYKNDAEQLCIKVRDTGIGIPKDKLEHIFDQFEQADTSTTRQYGGTGLGLAITRQLVSLLDGKIEVESELGRGTVFTVTLPIEQTEIKLIDQTVNLERKYGKRVLLCEDNITNQTVIKEILLKLGIDVEIVSNGEEAVEAVESKPGDFDLILMDLHMPEMDGFESTCQIHKHSPGIPIIALTAVTEAKVKEDCLNLGMSGYITKPIQKSQLIDELDKCFGLAS